MVTPMPDIAIDFPGRDRDELVLFYFRQHWIRLLGPFLRMIVWTVVLAAGIWLLTLIDLADQTGTRRIMLLLFSFFFLYAQFDFLNEFYRHFLHVIVVTNRKIHRIKKTLFFTDDHQSINVSALQDVHKSQHGPVQNLLAFGTLTLEAQESVLRIHFVPDIQRKYNAILHLRGWEAPRANGTPSHDPTSPRPRDNR